MQKRSRRISRPIVDRLNLWIEVPQVPHETLAKLATGESSEAVRARVAPAREKARKRAGGAAETNVALTSRLLDEIGGISPAARTILSSHAPLPTLPGALL